MTSFNVSIIKQCATKLDKKISTQVLFKKIFFKITGSIQSIMVLFDIQFLLHHKISITT